MGVKIKAHDLLIWSAFFSLSFWWWSTHPKKDLALMITSCWKTLKTVENLAEKPDLTLGTCLNLANSFLGFDQIWWNFQESAKEHSTFNFFGCNLAPVHQEKKAGSDCRKQSGALNPCNRILVCILFFQQPIFWFGMQMHPLLLGWEQLQKLSLLQVPLASPCWQ
jgi:hypothetical protein